MMPNVRHRSSAITFGVALVLASVIGGAIPLLRSDDPLSAVIAAAGEARQRQFEGQLGRFPYAPLVTQERRTADENLRLFVLRARAEEAAAQAAGDVRIVGIAKLIQGEFDQAVHAISTAAASKGATAGDWSDLAVAHIARAVANDDPQDLVQALAAADRALHLDEKLAAARFNRAVALERLGLFGAASAEYVRVVQFDPSSKWAQEASSRARRISHSIEPRSWKVQLPNLVDAASRDDRARLTVIVREHRGDARAWAEVVLLNDWASKAIGNERDLKTARLVASALEDLNGELLLRDAVSAIERSVQAGPEAVRDLSAGHRDYYSARLFYSRRQIADSQTMFARSRKAFAAAGSPMAFVAAYYSASARYDRGEREAARIDLRSLRRTIPSGYRALAAQVAWELGTIASSGGDVSEAIVEYSAALREFEALGETSYATSMRVGLAHTLASVGRETDAWRLWLRAFEDASTAADASRLETALVLAARAAIEARQWSVARSFLTVALERESSNPRLLFDAYLARAVATAKMGESPALDVRRATDAVSTILDESMRRAAAADLALANAAIIRERDPHEAIQLASRHIRDTARSGKTLRLPTALLERARARRAIGESSGALNDLRQAVSLLEERRSRIDSEELRDGLFSDSTEIFEELIDLAFTRDDRALLFDTSERLRARLLSDRLAGAGMASVAHPLAPDDVVKSLPVGAVLVEIVALPNRLLLVILDHNGVGVAAVPVARDALLQQGRSFGAAVRRGDESAIRRLGTELYSLLLAPLGDRLQRASLLVVVPDDATLGIPFAALFDGSHYLIERLPLLMSPSASVFARGGARTTGSRALIVGDPQVDPTEFPELQRLPSAANEARRLALTYQTAPLIGPDATRDRVIEGLQHSDIIHVAAHAVWSPRDPSLSFLALARAGDHAGALYVRQIARMRLSQRPVVVLAACSTAAASLEGGTVRSLASAFLTAGARSVVATLWDVDDELSRPISVRFHEELRAGANPPLALRNAQLALLHANVRSGVSTWAAFQISGTSQ